MSNACYCDYDGLPSVYRESQHVARKQHVCYECRRKIKAGEKYEYVFSVYDGAAQEIRTCQHCLAIRDWVTAHVPCFCIYHGNILDDARDAVYEYSHEAPGLVFGYLRRVVALNRAKEAAI